jgi:2,3-bisphosphoglycerate-independent phosphoglycerate mutase
MEPSSLFFLFVDGIGLGPAGDQNPFSMVSLPGFQKMSDGAAWVANGHESRTSQDLTFRSIDARLGIDGLPQSGTGQSTLFTGINCAALAGRHWGPFPHTSSRPILAEESIFARLGAGNAAFANAYPERFFRLSAERDRWSTTTRCCLDAGVTIRTLDHLRAGEAIAADLTGEGLARVAESPVEPVSEEQAAQAIARLCRSFPLVVAEYFHTDKAGHAQDMGAASRCLQSIDRFLSALLERLDWSRITFVLTSDHGNLEDLSVKTHTMNPVPLLVRGPGAPRFAEVTDLTGVAPAILGTLGR